MNNTELTAAIIAYAESDEALFVQNIPLFIIQAEQRIYNTVQIPVLRRNVMGVLTTGNQYLSSPTDFLAVYSLAVINTNGNYTYLLDKDVNFMREAYPNPSVLGTPKFYGIFGPTLSNLEELSFILAPPPDLDYNVELHYFYYPVSITVAGDSWLGQNYDPPLLYGALREAVIFQKGEVDMVKYYEDKYQESIEQLKRLCQGLERGDHYKDGQWKQPIR